MLTYLILRYRGGGGAQVFGIDVLLPKTMGIIGGGCDFIHCKRNVVLI